jgi:NAD(P)-dependent dehydrogenase (short-subunit alcohol dehydrogenase family)
VTVCFRQELAANQNNTIIGLARDKDATEKQLAADGLAGKNVTIIKADMTDRPANEAAAEATARLTGGGLDYLIVNAS